MKVGITGASGFVGGALGSSLAAEVYSFGRTKPSYINDDHFIHLDLSDRASFDENSFVGLDVLVHCAARVHCVGDNLEESSVKYSRLNADATIYLAKAAQRAGVKRFVFMSSIKACCDDMDPQESGLTEDSALNPVDAFGHSKAEAERRLLETFAFSKMDVVIIRSPLVYGPGVGANFNTMLKLASSGVPLPLGRFDENRRSFIYIGNLIEFIMLCLTAEAASGLVFLAADTEIVSTKQLFTTMRRLMKVPPHFFSIPVPWLASVLRLIGQQRIVEQLNVSLFLDCEKARSVLGWVPSTTFEQGMNQTVNAYMTTIK